MIAKARRFGLVAESQRFGQTAGLVELDVDHVIFAPKRGKRGAIVAGFVGTDRQGPLDFGEHSAIIPGGQRLFDHLHTEPQKGWCKLGIFPGAPAFVRVDDDVSLGGALTDSFQPRHIAFATKLDFQKRSVRMLPRFLTHRIGLGERQVCRR